MLTQVIPRTVFNNALVGALFGVLVPYLKGLEFLDPLLLLMYALLALFFVAPLAADAGPRLVPLSRALGLGWLGGQALIGMGLITVSLKFGRAVTPPAVVWLTLGVLSLGACLLTAALAARLGERLPAEKAKTQVRIGFLALLVILLGVPRLLNEEQLVPLLGLLTPEGLVRLTLVATPLLAVGTVAVLARKRAA